MEMVTQFHLLLEYCFYCCIVPKILTRILQLCKVQSAIIHICNYLILYQLNKDLIKYHTYKYQIREINLLELGMSNGRVQVGLGWA